MWRLVAWNPVDDFFPKRKIFPGKWREKSHKKMLLAKIGMIKQTNWWWICHSSQICSWNCLKKIEKRFRNEVWGARKEREREEVRDTDGQILYENFSKWNALRRITLKLIMKKNNCEDRISKQDLNDGNSDRLPSAHNMGPGELSQYHTVRDGMCIWSLLEHI
jgi:hypothetical protein